MRPHNRPHHQLWKKGKEIQVIDEPRYRLELAPVHIYRVAKIFKGIERNTYRQYEVQRVYPRTAEIIHQGNKKIGILKIEQQAKIDDYAEDEQGLSLGLALGTVDGIG